MKTDGAKSNFETMCLQERNQKRKRPNKHCSILVYQDTTYTKVLYLYQEYCVGVECCYIRGGGAMLKMQN